MKTDLKRIFCLNNNQKQMRLDHSYMSDNSWARGDKNEHSNLIVDGLCGWRK